MEQIESKYQDDLSKHNHNKNCIQRGKNTHTQDPTAFCYR